MQTCTRCKIAKDATQFYKNGVACKDCLKASDRARYANDPRVKARHQRYAASERGKERGAAAKSSWQSRNPDKRAAHVKVGNAVRDGKIIKPEVCDQCKKPGKIHAHHKDYSKPLEVDWLCTTCHSAEHKLDGTGPHAS